MRIDKRLRVILLVLFCLTDVRGVAAAGPPEASAESCVRQLYAMISVEPGGTLPDWDKVRRSFVGEAVVFMRTSREASAVFTLDEWVADFKDFIVKANVAERGFTESIVRLRSTEYRDVAQVAVLYEAGYPTSTRPPQRGVDFFQLAKIEGEWRIVSIVNEIPDETGAIPEALKE